MGIVLVDILLTEFLIFHIRILQSFVYVLYTLFGALDIINQTYITHHIVPEDHIATFWVDSHCAHEILLFLDDLVIEISEL